MQRVTSKAVLQPYLDQCLIAYNHKGLAACVQTTADQILSKKVKFPLLEYVGRSLYQHLPEEEHLPFCDQIEALKTEGGNVLLGIILQSRLEQAYQESLQKASLYISKADIWYVCDIIGERVFGYALLHQPQKTIPEIKQRVDHPSQWVVRSLGAGIHYGIKKGLAREHVLRLFPLLLSKAQSKNKEIRQGVGWAAKTTARFHPDIIAHFQAIIKDVDKVDNWFRKKIEIGLSRHDYAKGN